MSAPIASSTVQMPPPPTGTLWLLRFNTDDDTATLWLYKRGRFTRRNTGWSVRCASLIKPGDRYLHRLTITTATTKQILEATVSAAYELIDKDAAAPARQAVMDAKAAQVQQELGILVEVRRRP